MATRRKTSKAFKDMKAAKKTLQNNLLESGVAAIAAVGSKIGYDGLKDRLPEKLKKVGAAGVIGIGAIGNVFSNNNLLKAASLGLCGSGGVIAFDAFAPESFKSQIGFQSLGSVPQQELDDETYMAIEQMFKEGNEDFEVEEPETDEEFED